MEDFNSETDSDYTSYWRDWVGRAFQFCVSRKMYLRLYGLILCYFALRFEHCLYHASFPHSSLDFYKTI